MAESKIKTSLHFGSEITVSSVPFTADYDGFVHILASSSDANAGYAYYSGNKRVWFPPNGISNSAIFYIKKGETLTRNALSSNAVVVVKYIPLIN